MDVMARSRKKHICLGFCLKPSIGASYRKVRSLHRSEGFPRAAYFVPGRRWDGGLAKFRNCSGIGAGTVRDKYLKNT